MCKEITQWKEGGMFNHNVTTQLENVGTSTPGGYATTSGPGLCLWLNPVLWEFSGCGNGTVNSIECICDYFQIPRAVPVINIC